MKFTWQYIDNFLSASIPFYATVKPYAKLMLSIAKLWIRIQYEKLKEFLVSGYYMIENFINEKKQK